MAFPAFGNRQSAIHYLDPDEFAGLFQRPRHNRQRIAACIHTIAHQIVRGFVGPHDVLEDAAQEAVVHCLLRIHTFDRRRQPFSYFSAIIWNKIVDDLRAHRRRRQLLLRFEMDGEPSTPKTSEEKFRPRINPQEARAFREELRHRRKKLNLVK